MCVDPVTMALIAGGLQAGGTIMKSNAQDDVNAERNRVLQAEAQRQQQYQTQAQQQTDKATNDNSADSYNQQKDLASIYRTNAVLPSTQIPVAGGADTTNQSAPQEITDRIGQTVADAVAKGKTNIKNKALLDAYGDTNFNSDIGLARTGQNVQTIARNMSGSSSITPFELENANRAGNSDNLLGDLLSGAGSAAMLYGATMPKPAVGIVKSGNLTTGGYSTVSPFTGVGKTVYGKSGLSSLY